MDKLIELLKQIQDLAGVAIDALQGADSGSEQGGKDAPPPHAGGGAPGGETPPPAQ